MYLCLDVWRAHIPGVTFLEGPSCAVVQRNSSIRAPQSTSGIVAGSSDYRVTITFCLAASLSNSI